MANEATAGSIAARPAEVLAAPAAAGIPPDPDQDRDRGVGSLRGAWGTITAGRHNHSYLPTQQIGGKRGQAAVIAARPAELDHHFLTLGKTTFLQAAPARFDQMHRIPRVPGAPVTDNLHVAPFRPAPLR